MLNWLRISGNRLTGRIPPVGAGGSLQPGGVEPEEQPSELPDALGDLGNLGLFRRELGDQQRLTGRIPPELGGLYTVGAAGQQSDGRDLGNLYNLQWLRLDGNRLTGAIPGALADPAGLLGVSLADNRFSGCIPVSLRVVGQNDFSDVALPYCDLVSHCSNGAAADEPQQSTGLVEDCVAHPAGRGGLAGDSGSGLQSSVFGYWR